MSNYGTEKKKKSTESWDNIKKAAYGKKTKEKSQFEKDVENGAYSPVKRDYSVTERTGTKEYPNARENTLSPNNIAPDRTSKFDTNYRNQSFETTVQPKKNSGTTADTTRNNYTKTKTAQNNASSTKTNYSNNSYQTPFEKALGVASVINREKNEAQDIAKRENTVNNQIAQNKINQALNLSQEEQDLLNTVYRLKNFSSNTVKDEAIKTLKEQYGYSDDKIASMSIYLHRGKNQQQQAIRKGFAEEYTDAHPVIASATSVPMSVLGGALSIAGKIGQIGDLYDLYKSGQGLTFDTNNRMSAAKNYAQDVRSRFTDTHGYDVNLGPLGTVDIADFVYETAMSGADSLLAGYIGSKLPTKELFTLGANEVNASVGGALLGMNSAADTMDDLQERGASLPQAIIGGVVAGAFESFFEDVSISNMRTFKNLETKSIANGVGTGERVKNLILSTLGSTFTNATEEGLTETANIIYDTIANGDISNYAISIENYMAQGMDEQSAKAQAAKDLALQVLSAAAGGALMGAAFGAGGNVTSTISAAKLGSEIKKDSTTRDYLADTVIDNYDQFGTAYSLADQYKQKVAGRGRNPSSLDTFNLYNAAYQEANEFNNEEKTNSIRDYIGNIDKWSKEGISYAVASAKGSDTKGNLSAENIVKYSAPMVKADGKNVPIDTISSLDSKNITFKDSNGDTHTVSYDAIKDSNVQKLWRTASMITTDGATARSFIDGYDGGDLNSYINHFNQIYTLGKNGIKSEEATKIASESASYLGEALTDRAYNTGVYEAKNIFDASMVKASSEVGLHDLSNVTYSAERKKRNTSKAMMTVLDSFSKKYGLSITVVDSANLQGSKRSGLYNNGTNQIIIAVGEDGISSNILTRTAGHEVYHYVESMDSKAAQDISDFVISQYTELKGKEWVDEQIAKNYKNYDEKNRRSEFVADSMFDLLSSDRACLELARNNKGLATKIYNHFKRVSADIKSMLNKLSPTIFTEIDAMKNESERLEKIADKMFDALNKIKEEQAKEKTEYFKDDGIKKSFSTNRAYEETQDLFAIHNTSGEKLKGALELGGFPMPSIAIMKNPGSNAAFGDISIVFGKDTINPQKNKANKVYSRDAYTPTAPRVEYEIDDKKLNDIVRPIRKEAETYKGYVSTHMLGIGTLEKDLGDTGSIVNALEKQKALQLYYLLKNGIKVPKPVKDIKFNGEKTAVRMGKELGDDFVIKYHNGEANITNDIISAFMEKMNEEFREYAISKNGKAPSRDWYTYDNFGYADVNRMLESYKKKYIDGEKTEPDTKAFDEYVDNKLNVKKYQEWIEQTFSSVIKSKGLYNNKEYYTQNGTRTWKQLHMEYTLENVVKAMLGQKEQGGAMFGSNITGASAKEYKSIKDIKLDSDRLRLMNQDEFFDLQDNFLRRFSNLAETLCNTDNISSASSQWMIQDSIKDTLNTAVSKYGTNKQKIKNFLISDMGERSLNLDKVDSAIDELVDIVNGIRSMPTGYFEAKPRRAVGLGEILAVVVPNNTSKSLKDQLKALGLTVKQYKAEDEEDRLAKLNSIKGAKFSTEREADIGYHAGDLGKGRDTYYGNISRSRDSGHFGTGTYFVGNKEKLNVFGYKERPQHAADLSKFNLFKPKDADEGHRFHRALRTINGGIDENILGAVVDGNSFESIINFNDISKYINDRIDEIYSDGKSDYDEFEVYMYAIERFAKEHNISIPTFDEYIEDYNSKHRDEISKDTENADYMYMSSLYDEYESYRSKARINEVVDRMRNEYDEERWMYNELKNIFGEANTQKGLRAVLDAQNSERGDKDDSLSTVFMKALGYDGVNVNGMPDTAEGTASLDNTTYGSVVYNLDDKKDAILYSNERDAEYSRAIETNDEATQRRILDEAASANGYNTVAYHGTSNTFTEFDTEKAQEGRLGRALYFAYDRELAGRFGNKVINAYLKANNPMMENTDRILTADEMTEIGKIIQDKPDYVFKGAPGESSKLANIFEHLKNRPNRRIYEALSYLGYDSVESTDGFIAVFNPEQAKSYDLVTRNDNGEIILPSERFNTENTDIRYSSSRDIEGQVQFGDEQTYFGIDYGGDQMTFTEFVNEEEEPDVVETLYGREAFKQFLDEIYFHNTTTKRYNLYINNVAQMKYPNIIEDYISNKLSAKDIEKIAKSLTHYRVVNELIIYIDNLRTVIEYKGGYNKSKELNSPVSEIVEILERVKKEKIAENNNYGKTGKKEKLNLQTRLYSQDEIEELFYYLNESEEIKTLAERVFQTAKELGVRYKISDKLQKNVYGEEIGLRVRYNDKYFNGDEYDNQAKAATIIHEIIHACTSYVMDYNRTDFDRAVLRNSRPISKELIEAGELLESVYKEVSMDSDFAGNFDKKHLQYGATTRNEFVAELSNPYFRNLLKAKKLWQTVKTAFKKLFGIKSPDNVLDISEKSLWYILENPDTEFARIHDEKDLSWRRNSGKKDDFLFSTQRERFADERSDAFESFIELDDDEFSYMMELPDLEDDVLGIAEQMHDILSSIQKQRGNKAENLREEKMAPAIKKMLKEYYYAGDKQQTVNAIKELYLDIASRQKFDYDNFVDRAREIASYVIDNALSDNNSYEFEDMKSQADTIKSYGGTYYVEPKWFKERGKAKDAFADMAKLKALGFTLTTDNTKPSFTKAYNDMVTENQDLPSDMAEALNVGDMVDAMVNFQTAYAENKTVNPYAETKYQEDGKTEAKESLGLRILTEYFNIPLDNRSPDRVKYDNLKKEFNAKISEIVDKYESEKAQLLREADEKTTNLTKQKLELISQVDHLQKQIDQEEANHNKELEKLKAKYNEKIYKNDLADRMYYEKELRKQKADLKEKYDERIKALNEKIEYIQQQNKEQIEAVDLANRMYYERKLRELNANIRQSEKEKYKKARMEEFFRIKEYDNLRFERYKQRKTEQINKASHMAQIKKESQKLLTKLLKPTDAKHIPQELQKSALELCEILNKSRLWDSRKAARLSEVFAKLNTSENMDVVDAFYDEQIQDMLTNAMDALDKLTSGKTLSSLSSADLKYIKDTVRWFNHLVNNVNKAFKLAKSKTIAEYGENAINELKLKRDATKRFNPFILGNLKPSTFFDLLGSETMNELWQTILNGQNDWALMVYDGRNKIQDAMDKHNYSEWKDDKISFRSSSRHADIELTIEEALSLYATAMREQGKEHLKVGGIVLEREAEKTLSKLSDALKKKQSINVETITTKLALEDIQEIISKIPQEAKDYAVELRDYISNDISEKGNDISMKMHGIKKFNEKNYFPLKVNKAQVYTKGSVQDAEARIKNMGFTKQVTPKANNSITIGNFTDTIAQHISDMGLYYGLALPMEDFNRVYNYRLRNTGHGDESIKQELKRIGGPNDIVNKYIRQLQSDINGSNSGDSTDALMKRMMSKAKKNAVFGSLSVAIQQPSAIGRAMLYIDPKYFVETSFRKRDYEEIKRYSPVAIVKEMGYFDTNVGRQASDYMTQRDITGFKNKIMSFVKESDYRDEVLSKLPSVMDEVTWSHIWNAAKAQIEDTTDYTVGSEQYWNAVSALFNYTIDRTQVYDSVFSRSQFMRSKGAAASMLTAFMAEPTTSFNMLYAASINAYANRNNDKKKESMKFLGRAFGAYLLSIVLNDALKSLVTAARNKEDDEAYWQKYLEDFINQLLDEPFTLLPYVKDVVSLLQGYDVERMDVTMISDYVQGFNTITSTSKSTLEKIKAAANVAGLATGIPLKNLIKDAQGAVNVFNSIFGEHKETETKDYVKSLEDGFDKTVFGTLAKKLGIGKYKTDREPTYRELVDAFMNGNTEEYKTMREELFEKDGFKAGVTRNIKSGYLDGTYSKSEAINALCRIESISSVDANKKVSKWDAEANEND